MLTYLPIHILVVHILVIEFGLESLLYPNSSLSQAFLCSGSLPPQTPKYILPLTHGLCGPFHAKTRSL
jgi:hypothetical protein